MKTTQTAATGEDIAPRGESYGELIQTELSDRSLVFSVKIESETFDCRDLKSAIQLMQDIGNAVRKSI